MTNLRLIADHLGKPRIPDAARRAGWIENEFDYTRLESLPRYPTITILCSMAIGGVVLALAAASLIAFLIVVLR